MEWVRGHTIGHGSFGAVHLAMPRNCKGQFPPLMAVKSALLSSSASLRHEEDVLNNLSGCPQVVRCFGHESGKEFYNLFLEYASGGSLAAEIRKNGPLSESEAKRCAKSILRALSFVHDNGYVHCDLKLQNVLRFSNGVVKLADFGLAKRREADGLSLGGTPLYMAPESVTDGKCQSQADIWAIGCAVVEMVTGKPPWSFRPAADISELLLRIGVGEETPEIPAKLSDDGKDFLGKCFVRDPRKRWTARMLLEHSFLADAVDCDETVESENSYCEGLSPSVSPRSPFDFPDSVEAVSPAVRLRPLAGEERPDWSVSDCWVTVR